MDPPRSLNLALILRLSPVCFPWNRLVCTVENTYAFDFPSIVHLHQSVTAPSVGSRLSCSGSEFCTTVRLVDCCCCPGPWKVPSGPLAGRTNVSLGCVGSWRSSLPLCTWASVARELKQVHILSLGWFRSSSGTFHRCFLLLRGFPILKPAAFCSIWSEASRLNGWSLVKLPQTRTSPADNLGISS